MVLSQKITEVLEKTYIQSYTTVICLRTIVKVQIVKPFTIFSRYIHCKLFKNNINVLYRTLNNCMKIDHQYKKTKRNLQ